MPLLTWPAVQVVNPPPFLQAASHLAQLRTQRQQLTKGINRIANHDI